MLLRQGDSGGAVKALQGNLNKLGAIVLVDGGFGGETRDAIADARVALNRPGASSEAEDALQDALAAVADPLPALSAAGVTFIARHEVSSPAGYRRSFSHPIWPAGESGVTIGIGYDLRFSDEAQLRADWGDHLSEAQLQRLKTVLRIQGTKALADGLNDVDVPLRAAMVVFVARSLPDTIAKARRIYPEIDTLTPAQQTALASLVYNRGAALTDSGDPARQNRREMREIKALLAENKLESVADQIDSMRRLWDPQSGLVRRRHEEATLWRSGFAALQLA